MATIIQKFGSLLGTPTPEEELQRSLAQEAAKLQLGPAFKPGGMFGPPDTSVYTAPVTGTVAPPFTGPAPRAPFIEPEIPAVPTFPQAPVPSPSVTVPSNIDLSMGFTPGGLTEVPSPVSPWEPDLAQIVQQKAMEALSGKGGGGGGRIPTQPTPPMDFSKMLGAIAGQEVAGGTTTPRTMGMGIEDVRKEYGEISKAIDKQMERYLSTGGAANAQQQQVFDNALKIQQMQAQQSAQRRSEIMQYLQLAHQMSQDKRQQTALEMQLKREERMLEKDKADIELKQSQKALLDAKAAQGGTLPQNALNLRVTALEAFGSELSAEERQALAADPNYARHLAARMAIAGKSVEVQTESAQMRVLKEAHEEYKKNPTRAQALSGSGEVAPTTGDLNDPANVAALIQMFTGVMQ